MKKISTALVAIMLIFTLIMSTQGLVAEENCDNCRKADEAGLGSSCQSDGPDADRIGPRHGNRRLGQQGLGHRHGEGRPGQKGMESGRRFGQNISISGIMLGLEHRIEMLKQGKDGPDIKLDMSKVKAVAASYSTLPDDAKKKLKRELGGLRMAVQRELRKGSLSQADANAIFKAFDISSKPGQLTQKMLDRIAMRTIHGINRYLGIEDESVGRFKGRRNFGSTNKEGNRQLRRHKNMHQNENCNQECQLAESDKTVKQGRHAKLADRNQQKRHGKNRQGRKGQQGNNGRFNGQKPQPEKILLQSLCRVAGEEQGLTCLKKVADYCNSLNDKHKTKLSPVLTAYKQALDARVKLGVISQEQADKATQLFCF